MMFSKRIVQIFLWMVFFEERLLEEVPRNNNKSNNEAESSSSSSSLHQGSSLGTQFDPLNLGSESLKEDRQTIENFTREIDQRLTDEARLYEFRGHRHFKAKNYAEAVRDFKKAMQLEPSNTVYSYHLKHILLTYVGIDHEDIEASVIISEAVFLFIEIFAMMNEKDLESLGDEFMGNQSYGEAVRCYTEALKKKTPSSKLYRKRGRCHMEQRNFQMAIDDFRMVLLLQGTNPQDEGNADTALLRQALFHNSMPIPEGTLNILPFTELLKLGKEFQSRNCIQEAFHCYHEAIIRNPLRRECYDHRGKLYQEEGFVSKAIDDFLQVAKIDPDDEANWITLGHLLYESEKFNELLKYTRDLRNIDHMLELGDLFSSRGKWNEAIRCYGEALKKGSYDPEPYKRRGHLYWIIDIPNMAILDFLEVAKLSPGDEENWSSLSQILIENRRINELIEYVFQLADISQLPNMGDTFCNMGKYKEALTCYTEAIAILESNLYNYEDPHFTYSYYNCLVDGAPRIWHSPKNEEAFMRKPEDAEFYIRRAICHFKMEHLDEAMHDAGRAMELNPERREYWDLICRLFFDLGKFEDLIKYALQLTTSDEIIRLCEKLYSLDKFDEALHCYSKAIENKPHDPQIYESRGCFYLNKMKDKNLAKADFLTAVEKYARDHPMKNLGTFNELLFESEGFDELIKCTLRVEDEDELEKLGDKFYSFGKVEEAFRCYSEGLNKYPQKAVYHNKLGRYYWQTQDLVQALSYLKRAVKIEPGNIRYRVDLISVLDVAEKYDADTREVLVGCAELADVTIADKAWVEKMNQKMENKRIDQLIEYIRGLIIKDTDSKINAVRQENFTTRDDNDIESISNAVEELESNRNRYLEVLEFAHLKYTPEKIFPDLYPFPSDRVPDYLKDKINFELMENPVITPSGITYERAELIKHLQYFQNDPIGRIPLEVGQFRPNLAIKEAIKHWKKSQCFYSNINEIDL